MSLTKDFHQVKTPCIYISKEVGPQSRKISVVDIKDYDLSAKNPANNQEIIHRDSKVIMKDLESTEVSIQADLEDLKKLLR